MTGARTEYRIMDEPTPGGLAAYVVRPIFPLLGLMLGGAWLGLPWFVFNGLAMGSPSSRREIAVALAGLAGVALMVFALVLVNQHMPIPMRAGPYLRLLPTLWKLGTGYWLFTLQSRTFGLYEHFGGRVRNGLVVLIVGAFLVRGYVVGLSQDPLWFLTVT